MLLDRGPETGDRGLIAEYRMSNDGLRSFFGLFGNVMGDRRP